jgi:ATP-dependent DNA helicase RecG
METQVREYKSLQIVTGGKDKVKDLAATCVCFANAQGGVITIGFDDKTQMPPVGQHIEQKLINNTLERLRGLTFSVALSVSTILIHENGSEYFEITVYPSNKIIATTSDGKIFIRITDKCHAVRGEDLQRIAAEKDAFQWELGAKSIFIQDIKINNIIRFAEKIKQSDRVKDSIKEKSDIEILEHYNFVENNRLTNLGILWLGTAQQRSRLSYPITVQYIVYDTAEQKTRKIVWDDHTLNPEELIYAVEKEAVELNYSYEIPDGLFRKQIRHYPKEVVRELLINAFAHKSYLISADITIEVYPDKMKITSPGSLPLGITGDNILHEKHRRNPHLIKVLHDLKLMEAEGSGYDLIYEKLSSDAKAFPIIESDFNKVVVTLDSKVLDLEALRLLDYISQHYSLTLREKIVVGIVARHQKTLSTELTKTLQLTEEERLRTWTTGLINRGILKTQGNKKGTAFIINQLLLSESKLNLKPSLKTIEPYVLEELIKTDLRNYPDSAIGDIKNRIKDVDKKEIQRILYKLAKQNYILASGSRTYRKYKLTKNN